MVLQRYNMLNPPPVVGFLSKLILALPLLLIHLSYPPAEPLASLLFHTIFNLTIQIHLYLTHFCSGP